MARKATFGKDEISNKIERFKGTKGQVQIIRVLPSVVAGEKSIVWINRIARGQRPDGSYWYCNLNDDEKQNVAVEMGGRVEESGVMLVAHLGTYDMKGAQALKVLKVMPWSFGPDKWARLQFLGEDVLSKQELMVSCKTEEDEKFQRLQIDACPPDKGMFAKLTPDEVAALKEEIKKAMVTFNEFIKPMNRAEQLQCINGYGDQQPREQRAPQNNRGLPQGSRNQQNVNDLMGDALGDETPVTQTKQTATKQQTAKQTTVVDPAADDPGAVLDSLLGDSEGIPFN